MDTQNKKIDTFSLCKGMQRNNSMKKLAYIILVIAILLIISHFVKNGALAEPETANTTIVTEQINSTGNINTPIDGADIVNVQETSKPQDMNQTTAPEPETLDVQEETVEDIIISDEEPEDHGAVDVEETSEATMDEEETILPE